MAAPIQLKANKPGGNSYSKSVSRQSAKDGSAQTMKYKPAIRPYKGKVAQDSAVGKATISQAQMRPNIPPRPSKDYVSTWMRSKGLFNPQDQTPRIPYANVPADLIGVGTGTRTSVKKTVARQKGGVNSSATTKSRVKTTYTGRNFQNNKRSKIVKSK